MIDRKHIGKKLPTAVLDIEKGRVRFFAKVIGETNPIYTDEAAARAAGYPSLPVPPTFIFAAELDANTLVPALKEMGVDLNRILHGEQQFAYHARSAPATQSLWIPRSPTSTTRRTARSSFSSRTRSSPTNTGERWARCAR